MGYEDDGPNSLSLQYIRTLETVDVNQYLQLNFTMIPAMLDDFG